MGRLITETKYSEITATLERMDEFGVTADGFKKIRTMSPALLRQLSHMIENGVSNHSSGLPGLRTFDIVVDSRDTSLIRKKMIQQKIRPSLFVIQDVLEPSFNFFDETKIFITLTPEDFGVFKLQKAIDNFSSEDWLRDWSQKNLLGAYCLTPCKRSDAAIHIALAMDSNSNIPSRMILIYGEKNDWITIDGKPEHGGQKEIFRSRVDFSYNCPALFELQQI